jgi:hypothetical protein
MRRTAQALLLTWLAAVIAVGCGDEEGTGPGAGVAPEDLVGTWRATALTFTNPQDPSQSVDPIALGGHFTLTVAGDSTYWAVMAAPGEIPEIATGSWVIERGFLLVTDDSVPGETTAFEVSLSGSSLTLVTDEEEFDFDGDGVEEPAELRMVLLRVTGPTVADLEGTWDAEVFRFVSVPAATDTIDLIGLGGSFTVTVATYGRYTSVMTPPLGVPETDTGTMLMEADTLIVVSDTAPDEPQFLVFAMPAATRLELSGDATADFDGDGVEDPARLEAVLRRQ